MSYIERDSDGYYVGSVPEVKGCHTQTKSLKFRVKKELKFKK